MSVFRDAWHNTISICPGKNDIKGVHHVEHEGLNRASPHVNPALYPRFYHPTGVRLSKAQARLGLSSQLSLCCQSSGELSIQVAGKSNQLAL